MDKLLKAVVFSAAAAFFAFASQASAAEVTFNAPVKFAGTGCKPGSYSFSGQGTDTLTVLFSAYDAANPPNEAVSKMRRTGCSFVVPVNVPPGIQVSTLTSDWRGYAEGNVELHREYFFAGEPGPRRTTNPRGNYRERDSLMHSTSTSVWSHCRGGVVPLRINSGVRAKSRPSYIGVDSNDLKNEVIFHLKPRRCR